MQKIIPHMIYGRTESKEFWSDRSSYLAIRVQVLPRNSSAISYIQNKKEWPSV